MTVDEELSKLEEDLRRLKIEYESYFNGGSQRPPNDIVFRVEKVMKKFGSSSELTIRQRFKFNSLAQSYTVNNDLWRKKLKMKEEGAPMRATEAVTREAAFTTTWSDPDAERDKVEDLLRAITQARAVAGERADNLDPDRFAQFIRDKTLQCKRSLGCERVKFSVSVEEGRVKLRATKED